MSLRRVLLPIVLSCAGPASAANVTVVLGGGAGLTFSPQTVRIEPGDTVTFRNFGGLHNVQADDGSFRCARGCDNDGMGGSGTASSQLWVARVTFAQAGTFGYFCEPHGAPGSGMFGTVVVAAAPLQVGGVPVPGVGAEFGLVLAAALAAAALARLRRRRPGHG